MNVLSQRRKVLQTLGVNSTDSRQSRTLHIIGTSGFGYKEWRGHFYPNKLPEKEFLPYYAARLPGVEINNTFYRMPKASMLEAWADSTPEPFLFSVKAPRRITHLGRLSKTEKITDIFLEALSGLGNKLGAVLFQLPPNMKCDLERLQAFLRQLSGRVPAAFEFRHESWFTEPVFKLLEEHDVPLCIGEPDEKAPTPPLVQTASWGYARLRKDSYGESELARWASQLQSASLSRSFLFFKHEQLGPSYALRLAQLLSGLDEPA